MNLRHTFCTRFCENETNVKIIQEIKGHADITTTMDIYNEATKEKKKNPLQGLRVKLRSADFTTKVTTFHHKVIRRNKKICSHILNSPDDLRRYGNISKAPGKIPTMKSLDK